MDTNATGSSTPSGNCEESEAAGANNTTGLSAQNTQKPVEAITSTEICNKAKRAVFIEIIGGEILKFITDCGRKLRFGDYEALGMLEEPAADSTVIDQPGCDIFGIPLAKKTQQECACPSCGRTFAAARFAPHLEKCVGMGRNSSRIASLKNRRLVTTSNSTTSANTIATRDVVFSQNTNSNSSEGSNDSSPLKNSEDILSDYEHFEEDEDDEEWTIEKKKKTKKPGDKVSPKKKGAARAKNVVDARRLKRGDSPMSTTSSTLDVGNYDDLTNDSLPS